MSMATSVYRMLIDNAVRNLNRFLITRLVGCFADSGGFQTAPQQIASSLSFVKVLGIKYANFSVPNSHNSVLIGGM